ncbi:MAG TPA: 6,7-dimethyl-8-ribityllumazine synthase [Hyphomicrobiaceae bacterium]|nr:6,7-dimethyl-8-ribityllumazine synthase [Hyphomicrobiaceae bacterium]
MAGRAPPPEGPSRPVDRTGQRLLVIEARFHGNVADALLEGAVAEILAQGAAYERVTVPGALEIPQALASAAEAGLIPMRAPNARFCGAVALGCVIRGETSHYDIVCHNANHWLMEIAVRRSIPVGNGILTVDSEAQAMQRAQGGRAGKGGDAVRACLRLLDIAEALEGQNA